jgi:hypothetical protein
MASVRRDFNLSDKFKAEFFQVQQLNFSSEQHEALIALES